MSLTLKSLLKTSIMLIAIYLPCNAASYKHIINKVSNNRWIMGVAEGFAPRMGAWIKSNVRYYFPECDTYEEYSGAIKNFVQRIAEREGLSNPRDIKICFATDLNKAYSKGFAYQDVHNRIIGINHVSLHEIREMIKEEKEPRYRSADLVLWRAIISHECGHIKHDHIRKDKNILGVQFAVSAAIMAAAICYPSVDFVQLALTSSVVHGANILAERKISRMQEFEADDAVAVPEEMQALARRCHFNDPMPTTIFGRIKRSINGLVSTHPHGRARADRIEQRLRELQHLAAFDALDEQSSRII